MYLNNINMAKLENKIIYNGLTFTDNTIYSQTDKVRDRGYYICVIGGLRIIVGNDDRDNKKMYFKCEGLGIKKRFFINENIIFETAVKETLKYIKNEINKINSLIKL